jgi:hypothetical protein
MTGIVAIVVATILGPTSWKSVEISFYTSGKKTADGTRMKYDGEWVATRAFPLGSVVELRYGKKILTLKVRDKTAKHTAHRADLPKGTWLKFGAPISRGILRGKWRRIK